MKNANIYEKVIYNELYDYLDIHDLELDSEEIEEIVCKIYNSTNAFDVIFEDIELEMIDRDI